MRNKLLEATRIGVVVCLTALSSQANALLLDAATYTEGPFAAINFCTRDNFGTGGCT